MEIVSRILKKNWAQTLNRKKGDTERERDRMREGGGRGGEEKNRETDRQK